MSESKYIRLFTESQATARAAVAEIKRLRKIIDPSGRIGDARPLIVIDLGDEQPQTYVDTLHYAEPYRNGDNRRLNHLADQIEAQTKPARIPEPLRWGSKVRTARATYILLDIATLGRRWLDQHDGQLYKWDALADPILIREGVN